MQNTTLKLDNKCLFLDFFAIEHRWYNKHESLPKNFFTDSNILKSIKTEFRKPELCFVDNKAYLSKETPLETIDKLRARNTNVIASINTKNDNESRILNKIVRNGSPIDNSLSGLAYSCFKSVSPYGFCINKINEDEGIDINFPNRYFDTIQKEESFCFFCKRQPRLDGEWHSPGILLIMFVKNYGLLDEIEIIPQDKMERIASIETINFKKSKLRDFRKSSLLFELG